MRRPPRWTALALAPIALLATLVTLAPASQAGTAIVFVEDFEDGAFGPQWSVSDRNPASGLDYWGISDYRAQGGRYSAWCAQVGTQSNNGLNNSAVHLYDDNMQADLVIDLRVNGYTSLTLSFYYFVKAESGGGDFLQAWYEVGATQFPIFSNTGSTANKWSLVSVSVPTNVERLIIRFTTDAANHNFEGAYVDDLVLTGTESVPPTSSVSALPTYTNLVPYPIPYVAQDNANASGVAYTELWYRQGTSGAFTLYTRPANPLGRFTTATIPFDPSLTGGDGYYEFYTVAVDNAQNAEAPPTVPDASLTIDTTEPSLTITAPAADAWTVSSAVTVTWQATDALSGIAGYEVSINGGAFSAEASPSRSFPGLADGTHTVTVRATDGAGNQATQDVSFGVDTVAPTVSITSPSERRLFHHNTVTIRWTATDATSGVAYYEVWLDAASPTTTTDSQVELTAVSDGTHTFRVMAVDAAGNSAESRVTFRVNTNIWSFDGPQGAFPLLGLILILLAGLFLALFLWSRRREEEDPWEEPDATDGPATGEAPPEADLAAEVAPPPPEADADSE